jgi:hypothetical protein
MALELVITATKDFITPIKKLTDNARKTVLDESLLPT